MPQENIPVPPLNILCLYERNFKMSTQSEKNIGVAVIGCGGRGTGVTRRLLQDSKGHVKVLAVYDPDEAQCKNAMSDSQWKSPDTKICKSYQEAIATPGVDWVMVFSPNAYHKEHILEGFVIEYVGLVTKETLVNMRFSYIRVKVDTTIDLYSMVQVSASQIYIKVKLVSYARCNIIVIRRKEKYPVSLSSKILFQEGTDSRVLT